MEKTRFRDLFVRAFPPFEHPCKHLSSRCCVGFHSFSNHGGFVQLDVIIKICGKELRKIHLEKRSLWKEMTLFKCLRDQYINKAINYLVLAAPESGGKIHCQEL